MTAADFGGLDLTPEELAAPVLGVGPPDVGCREQHIPAEPACGACGSTTGAVLYVLGPLAGKRRCWSCAKPALET